MTANRIKEAAIKRFAESGYEGTSLSEIARLVGIKTPSIYAHFESKEQLFMTVFEEVIREEETKFTAFMIRIAGRSAQERLEAAFYYFTDPDAMTSGQIFLKRTMMVPPESLKQQLQEKLLKYETQLNEPLQLAFGDGIAALEIAGSKLDELSALFYGFTDGLLVEQQLYNKSLYQERRQLLWTWFWKAITQGVS